MKRFIKLAAIICTSISAFAFTFNEGFAVPAPVDINNLLLTQAQYPEGFGEIQHSSQNKTDNAISSILGSSQISPPICKDVFSSFQPKAGQKTALEYAYLPPALPASAEIIKDPQVTAFQELKTKYLNSCKNIHVQGSLDGLEITADLQITLLKSPVIPGTTLTQELEITGTAMSLKLTGIPAALPIQAFIGYANAKNKTVGVGVVGVQSLVDYGTFNKFLFDATNKVIKLS